MAESVFGKVLQLYYVEYGSPSDLSLKTRGPSTSLET